MADRGKEEPTRRGDDGPEFDPDHLGDPEVYVPEPEGTFDPTLMQSIQNDPCIHPGDWLAAYRAAVRGEPKWWLAAADEPRSDDEGVRDATPHRRESS
ncbi:MAG: hypothetical protein U0746_10555 [Gemmataceae bacterium]